MERVAEILGVKLGERFKVNGVEYCFDNDGLEHIHRGTAVPDILMLSLLLTGEHAIEKLPWKPKNGDDYFVGTMGCSASINSWRGDYFDYALYYTGNCFRTREEALTHAPEITEKMRKKYEEE